MNKEFSARPEKRRAIDRSGWLSISQSQVATKAPSPLATSMANSPFC